MGDRVSGWSVRRAGVGDGVSGSRWAGGRGFTEGAGGRRHGRRGGVDEWGEAEKQTEFCWARGGCGLASTAGRADPRQGWRPIPCDFSGEGRMHATLGPRKVGSCGNPPIKGSGPEPGRLFGAADSRGAVGNRGSGGARGTVGSFVAAASRQTQRDATSPGCPRLSGLPHRLPFQQPVKRLGGSQWPPKAGIDTALVPSAAAAFDGPALPTGSVGMRADSARQVTPVDGQLP